MSQKHHLKKPRGRLSFSLSISISISLSHWVLRVEEQFYFLFPALIAVAYGPSGSADRAGCLPFWRRAPYRLLAVTCVISLIACIVLSSTQLNYAFYLLPSRFWQLMAGALVHEWQAKRKRDAASDPLVISNDGKLAIAVAELAILCCFFVAMAYTHIASDFPFPWSLFAITAAVGYIGLGSLRQQRWVCGLPVPLLNACLSWGPIVYIGKLSYPLYLWHWPIFVCMKWSTGLETTSQRISALQTTVLLAMFTYHAIERPAQRWRPRRRAHIFAAALLLLLAAFGRIPRLAARPALRHILPSYGRWH